MNRDLSKLIYSDKWVCPVCGKVVPYKIYYEVDGQTYPIVCNARMNEYGNNEWDEIHKCPDCKNEFWTKDGN